MWPASTCPCTRPSPTCARSRPWWRRRASRSPGGAALLGRGCRRPHRRGQSADAGPPGDPLRRGGALRAADALRHADATVAATLKAALRHDMTPILCVGESGEERAAGKTESKLEEQVLSASRGSRPRSPGAWSWPMSLCGPSAPGSPPPPWMRRTPACSSGPWWAKWLVSRPQRRSGSSTGARCRGQPTDLMAEPNVDGLLVGGASLQAASFLNVNRAGAACYRPQAAQAGAQHGGGFVDFCNLDLCRH